MMTTTRLWIYHTKSSLLIPLDLCQAHYEILLITYLQVYMNFVTKTLTNLSCY